MARGLPGTTCEIWISERLFEMAISGRWWNKFGREVLREQLEKHHRERIPKHFRLGAHGTYGYAERREKTKKIKKYYWRKPEDLDLVRSGRTSRQMISQRVISFGGSFGSFDKPGAGLVGRLTMRFPFPTNRDSDSPGAIKIEQLRKEIVSTTEAERLEIQRGYTQGLIAKMTGRFGPLQRYR